MASEIIEKIINKLNLSDVISEYIDLQKKGKNYWAICPFHDDSNPSMSISNEKKIFKCFTCGAGGNVINFVSDYEKLSFGKAINKLAKKLGLDYQIAELKPKYSEKQQLIINALNDANNFFQYTLLTPEGAIAKKYTDERMLSNDDFEKYKIGFAPHEGLMNFLISKGHSKSTLINASLISEYGKPFFKNKITFAISNIFNDVIAFSSRKLSGDGPKYVNSTDSQLFSKSSTFYNINNAQNAIEKSREIYINEGFFDVIAMNKIGFINSVAIMGTSLTKKHLIYLKNKKVFLMFDFDNAGFNATIKSIKLLLDANIKTKVVFNNLKLDPDEILHQKGHAELKKIVSNTIDGINFIYNSLFQKQKINSPDKIEISIKKFCLYLRNSSDLEKEYYLNKISNDLKISKDVVHPFFKFSKRKIIKNVFYKSAPKVISLPAKENYSYKLLRSIIKSKDKTFQKYFLQKKVRFETDVLINIGIYISEALNNGKIKPPKKIMDTVKKIINEDTKVITTKNEMDDLIDTINRQTDIKIFQGTKQIISSLKTDDEKLKYLKHLQKIKKRK